MKFPSSRPGPGSLGAPARPVVASTFQINSSRAPTGMVGSAISSGSRRLMAEDGSFVLAEDGSYIMNEE